MYLNPNKRVEAKPGPFGLWFTLNRQVEVEDGKWVTTETWRTLNIQQKPKGSAPRWVWDFFIVTGVLA